MNDSILKLLNRSQFCVRITQVIFVSLVLKTSNNSDKMIHFRLTTNYFHLELKTVNI